MAEPTRVTTVNQHAHELLREADTSLWKLANGHALASLPVRDLLRVCREQQRQLDELRRLVDGTGEP